MVLLLYLQDCKAGPLEQQLPQLLGLLADGVGQLAAALALPAPGQVSLYSNNYMHKYRK